jgi:hypothetical protein
VKRGMVDTDKCDAELARVSSGELKDVAGSDLVIEAVPESLSLKLSIMLQGSPVRLARSSASHDQFIRARVPRRGIRPSGPSSVASTHLSGMTARGSSDDDASWSFS